MPFTEKAKMVEFNTTHKYGNKVAYIKLTMYDGTKQVWYWDMVFHDWVRNDSGWIDV